MRDSEKPAPNRQNRVRSHRDLIVWQKGITLAEETYRLANKLPAHERFILRQQMVRAGISIPSNIAEGHGRMSQGDYVRFLSYARGSLAELDSHLEIGTRLDYFNAGILSEATSLVDEVGRMLWSLMTKNGFRPWN